MQVWACFTLLSKPISKDLFKLIFSDKIRSVQINNYKLQWTSLVWTSELDPSSLFTDLKLYPYHHIFVTRYDCNKYVKETSITWFSNEYLKRSTDDFGNRWSFTYKTYRNKQYHIQHEILPLHSRPRFLNSPLVHMLLNTYCQDSTLGMTHHMNGLLRFYISLVLVIPAECKYTRKELTITVMTRFGRKSHISLGKVCYLSHSRILIKPKEI